MSRSKGRDRHAAHLRLSGSEMLSAAAASRWSGAKRPRHLFVRSGAQAGDILDRGQNQRLPLPGMTAEAGQHADPTIV
jgi:hypothetical protein